MVAMPDFPDSGQRIWLRFGYDESFPKSPLPQSWPVDYRLTTGNGRFSSSNSLIGGNSSA
jgi:hypothetical protein